MGKLTDLLSKVDTALSAVLTTWKVIDNMDPDLLNSTASRAVYFELDEQADGDFADATIPAAAITFLITQPITSYADDREDVSDAVDTIQSTLNGTAGMPVPSRFYARFRRGVLGNGTQVITAALSVEWENIT